MLGRRHRRVVSRGILNPRYQKRTLDPMAAALRACGVSSICSAGLWTLVIIAFECLNEGCWSLARISQPPRLHDVCWESGLLRVGVIIKPGVRSWDHQRCTIREHGTTILVEGLKVGSIALERGGLIEILGPQIRTRPHIYTFATRYLLFFWVEKNKIAFIKKKLCFTIPWIFVVWLGMQWTA